MNKAKVKNISTEFSSNNPLLNLEQSLTTICGEIIQIDASSLPSNSKKNLKLYFQCAFCQLKIELNSLEFVQHIEAELIKNAEEIDDISDFKISKCSIESGIADEDNNMKTEIKPKVNESTSVPANELETFDISSEDEDFFNSIFSENSNDSSSIETDEDDLFKENPQKVDGNLKRKSDSTIENLPLIKIKLTRQGTRPKVEAFKCEPCSRFFNTKLLLENHRCEAKINVEDDKVLYTCDVCKKQFRFFVTLRSHQLAVHNMKMLDSQMNDGCTRQYFCKYKNCLKLFSSESELNDHLNESHSDSFEDKMNSQIFSVKVDDGVKGAGYDCHICGKSFPLRYKLAEHINVHKKLRPFRCDACNLSWNHGASYRKHQKLVHNIICSRAGTEPCEYENCEMRFGSKNAYKIHLAKMHGVNDDLEESVANKNLQTDFQCDLCTRSFKANELLIDHINAEHAAEKVTHNCTECDKTFEHLILLMKHKKVHKSSKFVCDICGSECKSDSRLKYHRFRMHERDPIVCPEAGCNRRFRLKSELTNHMTIHTGVMWKCDKCNKEYMTKSSLTQHIRKEHDERYACFICSKKFFSNAGLEHHIKMDHDNSVKEYLCMICGNQFSRSGHLRNHLKAHENKKEFKCHLCDKSFNVKDRLRNHLATHTSERNYECSTCQQKFKTSKTLRQHRLIHFSKKYVCKICGNKFAQLSGLASHKKTHNLDE